jgi:hypothetical protein
MITSIKLIGDIHGHFTEYIKICEEQNKLGFKTIQLGDFGLGFWQENDYLFLNYLKTHPKNFSKMNKVIRGNHDDPKYFNNQPFYLGDFGYIQELDLAFVSGAYSIDKDTRKEGVSWWPEEELSIAQLNSFIDLVKEKKPKTIISHDCPDSIKKDISSFSWFDPSRTGQALEAILSFHEPEQWFFGHHHKNWSSKKQGKTTFVCIGERKIIEAHI